MSPHEIRIETVDSFTEGYKHVQAVCRCGWSGPERQTHGEASMDGNAHLPLAAPASIDQEGGS